nr:hypothetical protein [uncultured bacterium]
MFQTLPDEFHLVLSLHGSRARFEPRDHGQLIHRTLPGHFPQRLREWTKIVCSGGLRRKAKVCGHHAYHRRARASNSDLLSNNLRIGIEPALP